MKDTDYITYKKIRNNYRAYNFRLMKRYNK